ncbi:MAG: phosphoribosyl-AMP cyclohydrolase [Gammaproteobacteria bacterium]
MQSKITSHSTEWLDRIAWSEDGLAPVVTQESGSGKVLMLAWMNREALRLTAEKKQAFYWSRSRKTLWRKGERSGHTQQVVEIRLDCDRDAVLLIVEQAGGIACHTGRHSCFFERLDQDRWIADGAILKDPARIYGQR